MYVYNARLSLAPQHTRACLIDTVLSRGNESLGHDMQRKIGREIDRQV